MNRVVHFEIHAEDPARASKFYTNVFGWEITQWGEMQYWMVMTKGKGSAEEASKWPGIVCRAYIASVSMRCDRNAQNLQGLDENRKE